jgi:hypothetical protein
MLAQSPTAQHHPGRVSRLFNCFAPLSADRALESADFVVARRGKNASALSSSARRRAIRLADARLCLLSGLLPTPQVERKNEEEGDH